MKPLQNFSLVKGRILKVASASPAKPLKGHGNARIEISLVAVFARLQTLAPDHCTVVSERAPINRFGKLGFVPRNYVSPELALVIGANAGEFLALEKALQTVSESKLFT